jgi:hypothetical protein
MSIDTPPVTPQQYEVLHGGGAEAAEMAKQRLSRRRFLRRSILAIWGVSAAASIAGALDMLYPNLVGQFGASLNIGKKPISSQPHLWRPGSIRSVCSTARRRKPTWCIWLRIPTFC